MRSVFAFAGPKDSLGILKIMEADITPGGLQLLYTRRDDPYVSFLKESPDAKVGVIKEDGHIVATLAAIPRRMYIGGVPRKVCYVTNMKRLKEHDMYIYWHEMFGKCAWRLIVISISVRFLVIMIKYRECSIRRGDTCHMPECCVDTGHIY